MIADIITENEITPRLVASMPTRPTAPVAFGGKGYTAKDMKDAFDALSLLIIERFNALILDIREGRICEAVPTGLEGLSTLAELISGIESGALAGKIKYAGTSLSLFLAQLRQDVDKLLGGDEA